MAEQSSASTSQRSALTQAYLVIQELKAQLKAAEERNREPIAIIGMGCRFPGAPDPESFWQLLRDGVDATREVPKERWDIDVYADAATNTNNKNVRRGAFLDKATIPWGIEAFDADFFQISPREAISLDPHQRLLLEVSWEAIESAAIPANQLRNSNTGVYIGHDILNSEYSLLDPSCLEEDRYITSGSGTSFPAGRLSYFLGLQGPSLVVATACSSSLVSTCLAVQALQAGECDLALAGGVQLSLTPESTMLLNKINALAPDGRCKAFDASADGYGRGEGCGVVVLKRLSQAIQDGDPIRAVIRGSAINHDGPSAGLTVPSGQAQEKLLNQALKSANIDPAQIAYIEAHGTGTSLGDPIEVRALDRVLGTNKRHTPLLIGSVKTNIGHLEAAAGIASLIKVVLSLEHGEIPPSLHFKDPNPNIPWDDIPIKVATECMPWPSMPPLDEVAAHGSKTAARHLAGVSSFGFSGTNAHIILEQAQPILKRHEVAQRRPIALLTLSTKSAKALTEFADRYVKHLDTTPADLTTICFTANKGRADFAHRLSVVGADKAEISRKLARFVAGEQVNGLAYRQVGTSARPKIAFLFTGQGSQYVGMGRQLFETEPLFRQTLEHCDLYLRQFGVPLLSLLYPSGEGSLLDETTYTQPALFAIEYALAQVWQAWGINPTAVMGHSVGEYVAACVAGVFSLEDGLKLMAMRGRLMGALPQDGAMVSFRASEARIRQAIAPYPGEVSIAAINGPESIVIAGKRATVMALTEELAVEGIKGRQLTVSHAFHSPLMEPMLDEFRQVAATIQYQKPRLPLVSNMSGKVVSDEVSTAAYWVDHVRQAVRFADGVETLHQQNVDILLEVGPQATLLGMARLVSEGADIGYLPSLREGQDDWQQMMTTLGALYTHGVEIDWVGFYQGTDPHKVLLPNYPFQRQRYWISDAKQPQDEAVQSSKRSKVNTSLIEHLETGDVSALIALLDAKLSPHERSALPAILKHLVAEQQQQATRVTMNDWLYAVEWQDQPGEAVLPTTQPSVAQTWLILADAAGGVGEALAVLLRQQGVQPVLVKAGATYRRVAADQFEIDPQCANGYQQLLAELPQVEHVIHLWSLDAPSDKNTEALTRAVEQSCGTALQLIHALAKTQKSLTSLYLVTRGAQAVQKRDKLGGMAQATLWGMGRALTVEDPTLHCVSIDLDEITDTAVESALLVAEIMGLSSVTAKETQVAFRDGRRYVARLNRTKLPEPERQKMIVQPDATYLITGGLGGLGLLLARWLVEQGARHLLLMGRSRPTAVAQQQIDQLVNLGATVTVGQADVSKLDQVTTLLSDIDGAYPLRGVLHAAGISEDASLLPQIDWARFARTLAAKVYGTWHLYIATAKTPLDFFVSFSSISSLLGDPGLGDYAAANAFLDAFAFYQNRQGIKGVSVNWGAWAAVGMGADLEEQPQFKRSGYSLLPPQIALNVFGRLLQHDTIQAGVAPIEWQTFLKHPARNIAFFSEFFQSLPAATPQMPVTDGVKDRLLAASPRRRAQLLYTYLSEQVAAVLGAVQPSSDAERGFNEMGMDSLMSLELRQRLASDLQVKLPTTLTFEYSNVKMLGDYLLQEFFDSQTNGAEPKQSASLSAASTRHTEPNQNTVNQLDASIGHADNGSLLEDELLALENLLRR